MKRSISAMTTVHLYHRRRWLGCYNSPGSYTVAKKFGQLANSRFWDGLSLALIIGVCSQAQR
ncbi:hypothetical protein BD769DRAFT_1348918 [Suillus cothurnatus]|nr:hypothetical protein BD769DRAFT_1348918 [Suillus cothurnatus]